MLDQLIASGVVTAAAEAEGAGNAALLVGGGIMAGFLLLLLITVSFANRGLGHEAHAETVDPHRQHPNNHGGANH